MGAQRQQIMRDIQAELLTCRRCRLAGTRTHAIPGEGRLDARLLLIAQAPGKQEDQEGRMFVGPSGPIIDELLQGAGLSRGDVYMTNLVKCHLPKNRRPRQDEIVACTPYLAREIAAVQPAVLVPLGFYATRHILDCFQASRPSARADFRNLYGRLTLAGDQKIYPLPHPSALLHDRSFKPFMVKAYQKLRVLSRPCRWDPLCPMRRFFQQGLLDRFWIEAYCHGDWENCVRFQMEESGQPHSDLMLPDGSLLKDP